MNTNRIANKKLTDITINADPPVNKKTRRKALNCMSKFIQSSYNMRLNHAKTENVS